MDVSEPDAVRNRVTHFEIRYWRAFSRRRRRMREAGHDENALLASAIADQVRRGFWGLHFTRALEPAFREYLRATGQRSRLAMLVIGLVSMLATVLFDQRILGLPAGPVAVSRWVQLGLQVPLLTLAAGYVLYRPRRALGDALTLMAIGGMLAGIMVQRVVDADAGFYLPPELAAASILAAFTLARVQFWLMLAASALGVAGLAVAEVLLIEPGDATHYHLFASGVILTVGVCAGYSMEYFIRWMWLNGTLLRYMVRFDGLTGLFNRPALEDAVNRSRRQMKHTNQSYALALIDVDGFGDYNDAYGHQAGDAALRRIAGVLEPEARYARDVCGRYGGEEFLLLWCDLDAPTAGARAERTRAAVEALAIACPGHTGHTVLTVSIGLCWVEATPQGRPLAEVIAEADRRLYRAKAAGRNCVRQAAITATGAAAKARLSESAR